MIIIRLLLLLDYYLDDIIRFSNFSPSIPHSPGPTASECGWWGWPCLLVFGGSTIALLLQTHLNVSSLFKDYTVITSKSARLSVIEGARSWNLVKFSSSNVRLVKEVSEWAMMSVLQSQSGLLQKTILRLKNRYTSEYLSWTNLSPRHKFYTLGRIRQEKVVWRDSSQWA